MSDNTYQRLDEQLKKKLSTPEARYSHIQAAIAKYSKDESLPDLLISIRQIVQASIGFVKLAQKTGITKQALYRTLSESGNPSFSTVRDVLKALGYHITIKESK